MFCDIRIIKSTQPGSFSIPLNLPGWVLLLSGYSAIHFKTKNCPGLYQILSMIMALPAGFEPTAFRLGGGRSILLS